MKIAPWQQRRHRPRFSQHTNIALVHLLEVIAARRPKLHRQLRRTGPGQLFRMQSRRHPVFLSGFENSFRLRPRKRPAIAKHIAEFRQLLARHFRHQSLRQQRDIFFRSVRLSPEFRGHHVRSQKGGHNFQRLFRRQFPMQSQNLQFASDIEPIPALRLNRRRAVRRKLFQRRRCALLQSLRRRRAQLLHRIQDPAALPRNLFVARPFNLQLVFFRAARRVNQVGVRIHEPRQRHPPAQVQFFRRARLRQRFDLRVRPHRCDDAIAHQQRAIFDDP